ncbi:MAG TPA: hypothetical protein ENJ44_03965 [Oceanospirillales bacterium]|nr:hypothetical protein [Oceanospirillales bacterium]
MNKITLLIGILLLCACSDDINSNNLAHGIKQKNKFIKAAHYFADAWPKTFWQEFERGGVDADFKKIKADGFNTVILVVPWMGFEKDFDKDKTTSNKKMYARLDFLLQKIQQNKLDYMLRLGFPHDYSENTGTDVFSLCTNIYEKPAYQQKWNDYLQKVKEVSYKYETNQAGILVSWEDFWCPHFVFPLLEAQRRKELVQNIGFADWLMQKDKTTLKVVLAQNELKKSEISIPTKDEMAYFYYIEFIDEKFDEIILKPAKKVSPDAGMEIRIDKDPATSSKGDKVWISHDFASE